MNFVGFLKESFSINPYFPDENFTCFDSAASELHIESSQEANRYMQSIKSVHFRGILFTTAAAIFTAVGCVANP